MATDVPKKVYITGALGFIGRTLAERYRSLGSEVVGVDVRADRDRGVSAGDVSAPGPWQEDVVGSDLVIHTAAIVSNAASADVSWRMNVLGTRRVVEASTAAGAARLIHISSVRAFSDLSFPDGVDERHPVRTDGNPYVDTKVASEQVVLQAHAAGEVPVTVIRPGDVYGPRSRPWTILPVEAIRANRFVLPAMGNGIFSPVFVDNLIDGIVLASASSQAAGQVFTLSDGTAVSCRDFFAHYYRMLGKRGPVCVPTRLAVLLAAGNQAAAHLRGQLTETNPATVRYLTRQGTYSIDKARRSLGYSPRVDLNEGMERTASWLKQHRLI